MKKYAFFEVYDSDEKKEIYMMCTEGRVMEDVMSSLEGTYTQLNLKQILKHPDEIIYEYTIDVSKVSSSSVLWRIYSLLCADNWEPLGVSHFIYGGQYSTSSQGIYQFKKQLEDSYRSPSGG